VIENLNKSIEVNPLNYKSLTRRGRLSGATESGLRGNYTTNVRKILSSADVVYSISFIPMDASKPC